MLAAYAATHAALALVMALFVQVRIGAGFVSPARRLEPRVAALFSGFAGGATLLVLVALLLPWVLA